MSSPASSLWTEYVCSSIPKGLKLTSFSSRETKSSVFVQKPGGMISLILLSTSSAWGIQKGSGSEED